MKPAAAYSKIQQTGLYNVASCISVRLDFVKSETSEQPQLITKKAKTGGREKCELTTLLARISYLIKKEITIYLHDLSLIALLSNVSI